MIRFKIFLSLVVIVFTMSCAYSQNVGINENLPQMKLHVGEGDIYVEQISKGLILRSPNGDCWRLGVLNDGTPSFTFLQCPDTGSFVYGGETYKTKLMPDGQWWMTENLNIGTMINSSAAQTDNNVIEKHCYNNDIANCDIYGGMYQWNEMMQYSTIDGTQGVCPSGWHLPTDQEWIDLANSLGSEDIGSRMAGTDTLWNDDTLEASQYFGTSELNILPGGYGYANSTFDGINVFTGLWTSTEKDIGDSWYRDIYTEFTDLTRFFTDKNLGLSVRCIKD